MKLSSTQMKKVVELISEVELLMQCQTTFLHGEDGEEIVGILLADGETTEEILGPIADTESMN